jgi:hypothetical protein
MLLAPAPPSPCRHTTASEGVKAANDAAFKALNQAYQALMDGGELEQQQQQHSSTAACRTML